MKKTILCALMTTGLAFAAQAANVWDGGAAPDGNWSANNWGGAAPANSFSNDFEFAGSANLNTTNDLTDGTASSITFNTGDSFSLSGNGLKLGGDIHNISGSQQAINLDMELADGTIEAKAGLNNNMVINGTLSGTGYLSKQLVGILVLTGNNTYSGGTLINGTVAVGSDSALGTGDVTLRGTLRGIDNTRRYLANKIIIGHDSVTFGGNSQRFTFNGDVEMGSSDRTWTVLNAYNNGNFRQTMSGVISGAGALIKEGSGGLDLNNGGNTFSGGFTLVEGGLIFGQNNCLGNGLFVIQGGIISPPGVQSRFVTNAVSVEADFEMNIGGGNSTLAFNGDMDLNGTSRTITLTGPGFKRLSGAIGNGGLVLATDADGNGNLTLTAANTYTGDTTVGADVALTLKDNASLTFAIGANGVNNQMKGTGTSELDGDFVFDVSGADATPGHAWQIIDAGLLATTTFSSNFTVSGFVDEGGGQWTKTIDAAASYSFSEGTAMLSVQSSAPPAIDYELLTDESLALTWTNSVGFAYGVQTNNDLVVGGWGWVQSNLTGSGSTLSYTGETAAAKNFYRIIIQ